MKRWIAIALMLIVGLSGCMVSKSKYEGAVSDMESAMVEAEKGRMHQEALEEQIRNLKDLNEKISTDLEVMTTEVQRVKEGRQNEQTLLETRERELDQEKTRLRSKLRAISAQYQKVKSQNTALKKTVLRYKKELKGSHESSMEGAARGRISSTRTTPKTVASKSKSLTTKTPKLAIASKPQAPKIVTTPVFPKLASNLVNINKASVSDLVLTLGLSRDVAEEVVSNRPYRLRGELVAKNVIPKATFDEIKGRITASP